MKHAPHFHFLLLNITRTFIILCSLGSNSRDVTAKQMDGAVPIFDMLLYEKYIPHKHLSTSVQRLVPYFHKPTVANVFSVKVKL
jgi:hypothetical protein